MFRKIMLGLMFVNWSAEVKAEENQYGPIWSPDGQYLAYTQVDEKTDWEVMIKNVETGNIKQVTHSKGYDTDITWSPDGEKIAYTSSRSGERDIYLYDIKSDKEHRLISSAAMDNQPRWSPDGKHIVFLSRRNGLSQLYLYTFATKKTVQLTDLSSHVFHPSWYADSSTVIFDQQIDGHSQIFKVDISSKKVMDLYLGEGSNIAGIVRGNTLTFSSNRSGNWDILQYHLLTGKETILISTEKNELKADWHPTKNEVSYMQQNEQGDYQLIIEAL